ncbi:MAG: Uma2 family endonuclease [Candidatus Rokubacteria bacterium]|nr:Uma2 family endonuclease [Candidatus Rokubacteria bacterium]
MVTTVTRLDRRLRARDLDNLPHEWDTQYELIAGVLHMARRPSFEHQAFLARLLLSVGPPVFELGGHVVQEPGLVWEDDGEDNVSPDLAILLRVPAPPRGQKLRTCPDIVVEVVSEGEISRRRDYAEKRELYLRRGALEYSIADLAMRTLLRLVRTGDEWREERLGPSDRLTTPLIPHWDGVVLGDLLG